MKKGGLKQLKKNDSQPSDLSIQKGLMNIYSNKDGSLPDISHLDVRRKSRFRLYLFSFIGIGIILAAIVWLGFIVLNPDNTFSNQSIELEIKSQQSIASGDEVIYILEYTNVEKVPLHDIEIIFRYPEGFKFSSATPEPTNDFNTSWDVKQLAKKESGKIEVVGKLIGEVGSIKTINATVSYRPENFSSVFKETTSFTNQITSSILEINIEGPEQILPEKKATYKISYRNNSDQELAKIKILVDYPANFIFQESLPEPFHNEEDARNLNNQWVIENLGKNQQGEIEIYGGFLTDEQLSKPRLIVQIGFLDEEFNEFSLQQEKSIITEIIESNLKINLIINGSSQNQPINFDKILTYSIIYKNLGQKDLAEVSFTITIDSDILNFVEIKDKNFGIIDSNTITWGMDQISELELVRPLDEGSIDFSVKIFDSTEVNLETDNLQVKSKVEASIAKIGELKIEELLISSNEILNNINTDIQLKVEGRYFDEDNIAVGTGPLPPVVGEKTTFRIYWYIANSLHEVSNVVVSTVLPDGVEWVDKFLVNTGQISYRAKDKQVSWLIKQISAGQDFQDVNTWFDVAVTPTKLQERKLLILTDQTFLAATDERTESEISKNGKAITSNLDDDPVGGGRGLVIDITD